MHQAAKAVQAAEVAQAKYQSPRLVDAEQSLVGSICNASQACPVTVPYVVIILYPRISTPLYGTARVPQGLAMLSPSVNKYHEYEHKSVYVSKFGGAVERSAGNGV